MRNNLHIFTFNIISGSFFILYLSFVTINSDAACITITSCPSTASPGQTITVAGTTATGFGAHQVNVYFSSSNCSGQIAYNTTCSSSNGNFSTTISIPGSTTPGQYYIYAYIPVSTACGGVPTGCSCISSESKNITLISPCTNPTSTVNDNSGYNSVTLTCNASGGSGGSYSYKWYSGTSCSGTVLGTNSTLAVTSSGNYSCKAYISGFEASCYGCDYGYANVMCVNPTVTVNDNSGNNPVTMTCLASGGSGGSYAYKWYNGTSCSGTVLGTNSTLNVTTSGNYACKAYITGYENNCYGCDFGYATVTSCTNPTSTVNDNSGYNSVLMTCNASGGSGGSYAYKWYSGTSCSGSVLGTNSTLTVTSSGNYACKVYINGFENNCYGCDYGYASLGAQCVTITSCPTSANAGQTITVAGTTAPGFGAHQVAVYFSSTNCSGQIAFNSTCAAADGSFSTTIAIPASQTTGQYYIYAYIPATTACSGIPTGCSCVTSETKIINIQAGCTNPTVVVDDNSGTGPVLMTCNVSGGSGGSYAYKWYNGTSCTSTVIGTNSTFMATSSGNYACKAYITNYENLCFACDYGYATVTPGPCTSPTCSVDDNSGQSSVIMTCNASGGSGGAIAYKWYSGTTCTGTVLGENATLTVTTSGNYTCKAYITNYENTCFALDFGYANITIPPCIVNNFSIQNQGDFIFLPDDPEYTGDPLFNHEFLCVPFTQNYINFLVEVSPPVNCSSCYFSDYLINKYYYNNNEIKNNLYQFNNQINASNSTLIVPITLNNILNYGEVYLNSTLYLKKMIIPSLTIAKNNSSGVELSPCADDVFHDPNHFDFFQCVVKSTMINLVPFLSMPYTAQSSICDFTAIMNSNNSLFVKVGASGMLATDILDFVFDLGDLGDLTPCSIFCYIGLRIIGLATTLAHCALESAVSNALNLKSTLNYDDLASKLINLYFTDTNNERRNLISTYLNHDTLLYGAATFNSSELQSINDTICPIEKCWIIYHMDTLYSIDTNNTPFPGIIHKYKGINILLSTTDDSTQYHFQWVDTCHIRIRFSDNIDTLYHNTSQFTMYFNTNSV